jgi:hypothetical protein
MSQTSSTTKQPVIPPPPHITHGEGDPFTCTWDNGVVVEAALHQRTRRGKYPVKVLYGTQQVGSGTVDLADLNDRERLHAECSHLDGQVGNWLAYLMHVSDAITTRMQADAGKRLQVVQLSTVTPERVEFLWKPFLPKGRPVAIEGDPGVGKSGLVMKLIAHLTAGKAFPTLLDGMAPQRDFPPQNVCLLTSEDDPGDTLVPRLEVNGGDP